VVLTAAEVLLLVDTHCCTGYRLVITPLARLGRTDQVEPFRHGFNDLPCVITGLGRGQLPDGWAIAGRVTTLAAGTAGTNVQLQIQFFTVDGASAGNSSTSVALPAVGESVEFQVDLVTSADVAGYRYVVQ
jgi:hypothetical protein